MRIRYHKRFEKRYKKLDSKTQKRTQLAIKKFTANPQEKSLKNHALTSRLKGLRAFSVTGSIRVIFEEHGSYTLVVMIDIGTHAQVYE